MVSFFRRWVKGGGGLQARGLWAKLWVYWPVVQLAARLTLDQKVPGSSPGRPVEKRPSARPRRRFFFEGMGFSHQAAAYRTGARYARDAATVDIAGITLRVPKRRTFQRRGPTVIRGAIAVFLVVLAVALVVFTLVVFASGEYEIQSGRIFGTRWDVTAGLWIWEVGCDPYVLCYPLGLRHLGFDYLSFTHILIFRLSLVRASIVTFLLSAYPLFWLYRRFTRPRRRRRNGRCVSCGYDLTGNVTGVCSECGTPIKAPMRQQATVETSA